ncbi:helix-turn-helix domain-containing protein [Phytoactinopolyspora limicola]|uniref:helix-turn-helix domain-containing protein n=1 Tax=Phytoactinopolyspora limicola TaxID=2715536 RepID=UPI003CCD1FE2
MTRPANTPDTRFQEYGQASAFTFCREPANGIIDDLRDAPRHTHLDLEVHFVETGGITLDCAGREVWLAPGELLAFWGGIPHRDVDPAPPRTVYHVAHVPIVNVLTWTNSAEVLDRILAGELLRAGTSDVEVVVESMAFQRWSKDLLADDSRLRTAAEMEIQARLIRLLSQATATPRTRPRHHIQGAATQLVAQAIRFATAHFVDHITIDDIAQAVGRHHDHLMTSFRRVCGLTLWEYVVRLRLAESQRLLRTTNLPIRAVAHRAGFGSTSGMYNAFHRHVGQTPAAYRFARHP